LQGKEPLNIANRDVLKNKRWSHLEPRWNFYTKGWE